MTFETIKEKMFSMIKNKHEIIINLAILLVLITGIILRIKVYLYGQGIIGDQVSLVYLNVMQRNYLDLFQPLDGGQVAPPLFLVMTKFFFTIGKNINGLFYAGFGAKFFAQICSLASIFAFYALLNKVFKNKLYIIICLMLFCFNAAALNYAQEAKQYSTDLLFSVLLIYIFYTVNFKQDSVKKISFYSLILVLSLWFSTSAPFVIAAGFCYLIFDFIKNKTYDKKFLIVLIPFALSFLIWFLVYYIPVKEFTYGFMYKFWSTQDPKFLSHKGFKIFSAELNRLIPFNLVVPSFIAGILILLQKKENKILALTGLPILLCMFVSFLNHYPFELRLILFLLPSIIIITMAFLLYIEENKNNYILILIFVIVSCLQQFENSVSRRIFYKSDIIQQMKYIVDNKKELSGILTFYHNDFAYYLRLCDLNIKIIFMDSSYNKEKINRVISSLEKNKTYIIAIPTTMWHTKTYSIELKQHIQNDKNVKIIDIKKDKKDNNIYLIKFKIVK